MKVTIVVRLANKIYSTSFKTLTIACFVIVSSGLGNAQIARSMLLKDCDSGLIERIFTNRYITEAQACILLNQQEFQLKSAEENIEMLVQENLSFRVQIEDLKVQLLDKKQKFITASENSNAQSAQLKACSLQRDRLYIENSQLIEDHKALLSQYNALTVKESEANSQNLLFATEINALKEKRSIEDTKLNHKVSLLEQQLENCQQKMAGKNTENQVFLKNIKNLQVQVRSLQKIDDDRKMLRSENAELRKQNENLLAENKILKERISKATLALEEVKILVEKTGALTSQLVSKDMEIERLQNALAASQNADAVHMKKTAAQAMRKLVIDFQSTDPNIGATMNNDVLSILVSDIFKSNSMDLSSNADLFLDELATALTSLINADSALPYRFIVVGHADKTPISSDKFSSNWELSAYRAAAVVKALIGRGIDPSRFVAASQAEFDPIDQGDTKEALKNNRRIEIHTY